MTAVCVVIVSTSPTEVALSHGRHWSHIASFPSGHLIVSAAMAAAAATAVPRLRRPLMVYVAAVAATRVLFGAHFPLDVLMGAFLGGRLGQSAAALVAKVRLLPAPRERTLGGDGLLAQPAMA